MRLLFILFVAANAQCACDRLGEFGHISWKFIHTLASNYPDHPTVEEKQSVRGFVDSIAMLYPCYKCRNHLQANLLQYGYHLDNRTDFSMWACFLHNRVNIQRNTRIFSCDIKLLDYSYNIHSQK